MANYYADSSVLVKRHVNELGSQWFRGLVDVANGHLIFTARVSLVEVYSALNRRAREAHLALADYTALASDFTACAAEYQLVELTPPVVDHVRSLLERHSLRAYDALQLASAQLTHNALAANQLAPLTFLRECFLSRRIRLGHD